MEMTSYRKASRQPCGRRRARPCHANFTRLGHLWPSVGKRQAMQLKAMVHIAVPRIPAWVGLLALCAALVLTVGAGVLPERWQDPALFLGVGLAFGSVGGILFSVLTGARPDWQGVATVTGMILGVIPVIGLIMSPRLQHPPDATPVSVTRAAAPSSHLTAAMAFPQRTQERPHLETQSQAGAQAAPDRD